MSKIFDLEIQPSSDQVKNKPLLRSIIALNINNFYKNLNMNHIREITPDNSNIFHLLAKLNVPIVKGKSKELIIQRGHEIINFWEQVSLILETFYYDLSSSNRKIVLSLFYQKDDYNRTPIEIAQLLDNPFFDNLLMNLN